MSQARIYTDFQNADPQGRVRLELAGTVEDLARQQVHLREGLPLTLYAEDADDQGNPVELQAEGIAAYSQDERCWVAMIDWTAIRRVRSTSVAPAGGSPSVRPASTISPHQEPQNR